MKRLFISIPVVVFTYLCFSCHSEDIGLHEKRTGTDGQIPIDFVAMPKGETITKATNTQWANGDSVGIFMKKAGQVLSAGSLHSNASNVEYKTDANGNMSPASQILYYPPGGQSVDFIAYYPYKKTITNFMYPVDVGFQANLSRFDLMYSNNVSGVTNGAVNLNFRHMLTRLVLNINIAPGTPGTPDNLNFSFPGFLSKAEFSLIDGSFSNYDSTSSIYANPLDQGQTTLTLLLLPSVAGNTSNRSIHFSYFSPEINYTAVWDIPSTTLFESGKSYTYNVTINRPTTRSGGSETGNVIVDLESITDRDFF